MSIHLAASGYAITECGLTSVRPAEVTGDSAKRTCRDCWTALVYKGSCPECEQRKLSWAFGPGGTFNLGCDNCSETLLAHVTPQVVATALTEMGWRP